MKNAAIVKYLSKKPCVICSSGTQIEAANEAATRTGKLFVGDSLASDMSPLDVLKFEASVKSAFPQSTIIVPITTLYSSGAAAVYFEEILGRYFAVVAFFKSLEECERSVAGDDNRKQPDNLLLNKLIEDLVEIPDKGFSRRNDIGMFRAAELAERAVRDIAGNSTFFDCDVEFECSPLMSEDVFFSGIGLHSFLKAVSLIMYAVNDLSFDRKVTVYTSAAGKDARLCFKTVTHRTKTPAKNADDLAIQVPTAGKALILSDYIAGSSGFSVAAECDAAGNVTVSLRKNYTSVPGLEFKCRDQYDGYDDGLARAVEIMENFPKLNA